MSDHSQQAERIHITIAGMAVALVTDDPAMARRIRQRYAAFLGATAAPRLTVALTVTPDALFVPPAPGPWVIESSYRDERLDFLSYTERGHVDLKRGAGLLELAPTAHVENFLRVAYAWLCLQDNALLLHAAGVIRHGRGYVFFGPSGAGKTTTSRLAARTADVVSDDLVIIRCQDGRPTLHGVPFKGELSDAPRANQSAPLHGLFRLRQDTSHSLEALPPARAVAELAASSPFVVKELALSGPLIGVCNQIARAVPVQLLHFRRDDAFWMVIDGQDDAIPETASANGR